MRGRISFRPILGTITAAILCLGIFTSLTISDVASQALRGTLNSNWRGAYDLLVLAPAAKDALLDNSASAISPLALTSSSIRLTLDDVTSIRNEPDIEIAAPLGDMYLTTQSMEPAIFYGVKLTNANRPSPKARRVTFTVETNDGLGWRYLAHNEHDLIVDDNGGSSLRKYSVKNPTSDDVCSVDCVELIGTPIQIPEAPESWSSYMSSEGGTNIAYVPMEVLAVQSSRVLMVDPDQEAKLLKIASPSMDLGYLARLDSASVNAKNLRELTQWAKHVDTPQAKALDDSSSMMPKYLEASGLTIDSPAVPIITTAWGNGPSRLIVDSRYYSAPVDSLNKEQLDTGMALWNLPSTRTLGPSITQSFDVTGEFQSLNSLATVLPLENSQRQTFVPFAPPSVVRVHKLLSATLLESTKYSKTSADLDTATPYGYVIPRATTKVTTGQTPGADAAYLKPTETVKKFSGPAAPVVFSVDTFSVPDSLSNNDNIMGAPVLTDRLLTSVLDLPNLKGGTTLYPSSSGLGVANQIPAGYAALSSSEELGIDRPVSVVRVRVQGISSSYSPENLGKIQETARRLESKGFGVISVAGSSMAPHYFALNGYAFGTDSPKKPQMVGLLDRVRQEWSELGAAGRVKSAVENGNETILVAFVIFQALLTGLIFCSFVSARRRSATILEQLGWSKTRIFNRFLKEDTTAILMITGTLVTFPLFYSRNGTSNNTESISMIFAAALALGVILIGLLSTVPPSILSLVKIRRLLGKRKTPSNPKLRRVVSPFSLAFQRVTTYPRQSVTVILAVTLLAVSASLALFSFRAIYSESGESILAHQIVATNSKTMAILALLASVSGTLVLFWENRSNRFERLAVSVILKHSGWSMSRRFQTSLLFELIIASVACILTPVTLVIATSMDERLRGEFNVGTILGEPIVFVLALATLRTLFHLHQEKSIDAKGELL